MRCSCWWRSPLNCVCFCKKQQLVWIVDNFNAIPGAAQPFGPAGMGDGDKSINDYSSDSEPWVQHTLIDSAAAPRPTSLWKVAAAGLNTQYLHTTNTNNEIIWQNSRLVSVYHYISVFYTTRCRRAPL